MSVPGWWEAALLALASHRIFRLIALDTILDRPRAWALNAGDWRPDSGDDPPRRFRAGLATFISCPWCAGFWITVAVYVFWQIFPHATLVVAAPLAISSAAALIASKTEP